MRARAQTHLIPVEEHDGAVVVKLVHLCETVNRLPQGYTDDTERTLLKSGTWVMSTVQMMAKFLTFSEALSSVSSITMHSSFC